MTHSASAVAELHNCHGYPWRPTCSCGWVHPWRYASRDAGLLTMAECHGKEAIMSTFTEGQTVTVLAVPGCPTDARLTVLSVEARQVTTVGLGHGVETYKPPTP